MISVVSGMLGSGKSYWLVDRIRLHLRAGGIVATNLDLNFEEIRRSVAPRRLSVRQYMRVSADSDPRKIPRGDFRGSRGARRVMVVLDEALNWFASQPGAKDERRNTWGEWLRQSDKLGQDVFFVSQDFSRSAKWIRELAQMSHHVINFGQVRFMFLPLGRLLHLRRFFVVCSTDLGTHTTSGVEFGLIRPVVWRCYNTAQLWGFSASSNAYDSVAIFPAWRPPLRLWFVVLALFLWGVYRYASAS